MAYLDLRHDARALPVWHATAGPGPDCPPLRDPAETDVAIVGAGLLGLSTALALAESGVAVTVLEAGQPGEGASGRSGGQVIPGLRFDPAELVAAWGQADGMRAHAFGLTDADRLWALIAKHGIACHALQAGWIQAADTEAGLAAARERAALMQRLGAPVRLLSRDGIIAMTGTDAYLGGWLHEGGGTVNPLALARGLARAAIAAGAAVHGGTRVTRLARSGESWVLTTQHSTLRARRVLLATNANTAGLLPDLTRSLIPVWSFQIATVPLLPANRAIVLPGGQCVSDTRRVLRYFRTDPDGRIVLGGKGVAFGPHRSVWFDLQRAMLRRLYPRLDDLVATWMWGGQVAITPGRLPTVHRPAPGLWTAIGCNGKGVAWCTAFGAPLAEAIASDAEGALPIPVTPLRPQPFHAVRRAGVAVVSAASRARDRFDRPLRG